MSKIGAWTRLSLDGARARVAKGESRSRTDAPEAEDLPAAFWANAVLVSPKENHMSQAQTLPDEPRVSEADYLARETGSPVRHEFVDGIVYAMAGGTNAANLITLAIAAALKPQLRSGCRLFALDAKLRIATADSLTYYYPDVMVTCRPVDLTAHFQEHPSVVVEVLSPSTERIDKTEKMRAYTNLTSVQEYLLIAQDTPRVELLRRTEGWRPELFFREHTVELPSIGTRLAVEAIYAGIVL